MEQARKKWVNLSYFAIATLVGFFLFTGGFKIAGRFDLEARVRNIDWFIRIGSLAVGALVFTFLYRNKQANQFADEVILELSRVTWPTQKDTARATWVVMIMVLFCGLMLGGFDVFLAWVMKWIL